MASRIDIWNTALSHIGHRANIGDPDEASAEANHCRRFYPMALAVTLERYAWTFATTRTALAPVDNPVNHWSYAYALPNLCVKPRAVLFPNATDDTLEQPFTVEADEDGDAILYTNAADAVLRYTLLVTDTVKFTPMFVMAVSYDLAALLVGPIPKDPKMKASMMNAAASYAAMAEAADANASQDSSYKDFMPSHLSARNS